MEGVEADDLIATYSQRAKELGHKVTVVSPDKDMLQLVDESIRIYHPIKKAYISSFEVAQKFGVLPSQLPDYQALFGDKEDNGAQSRRE